LSTKLVVYDDVQHAILRPARDAAPRNALKTNTGRRVCVTAIVIEAPYPPRRRAAKGSTHSFCTLKMLVVRSQLQQTCRSPMSSDNSAYGLYLHLMKRCLIDGIYLDDPLAEFVLYHEKARTPAWKRMVIRALQSFLARYHLRLVEPHSVPWMPEYAAMDPLQKKALRDQGLGWPSRAHTFLSIERLNNIQHCVETVIRDEIRGDLIETGVWRGGACILMRAILKARNDNTRTVWLADSFEGLPPPNASAYPADVGDKHYLWSDQFAVSRAEVEENFRRYGLLDQQVQFLEGWFKDTLPKAPIKELAVMRLDGDMYGSTIRALESLYDRLLPGGFVIIDDYYLEPCAKAVHDFRSARDIVDSIEDIDGRGAFWRRSA
jgi:O-methyltransferase